MKTRIRVVLAVAFLVVATAVASAMAFTGPDLTAARPEVRRPAATAELIRAERRESFQRRGCEKHLRQNAPDDL